MVSNPPLSHELEKARPSTAEKFLQERMSNRIKKILGHSYEIIHVDSSFVYYGYTTYDGERRRHVQLQRLARGSLEKLFPGFRDIDGKVVLKRIGSVLQNSREARAARTMVQDFPWEIAYAPGRMLEVLVKWEYSLDGAPVVKRPFLMLLDAKTGKIRSVKFLNIAD